MPSVAKHNFKKLFGYVAWRQLLQNKHLTVLAVCIHVVHKWKAMLYKSAKCVLARGNQPISQIKKVCTHVLRITPYMSWTPAVLRCSLRMFGFIPKKNKLCPYCDTNNDDVFHERMSYCLVWSSGNVQPLVLFGNIRIERLAHPYIWLSGVIIHIYIYTINNITHHHI